MIILTANKTRLLKSIPEREWRSPSVSLPKDQMGNEIFLTRFIIKARANDGAVIWRGLFDDRSDFDAFLWAIVCGTLKQERALWDLPTPSWQPWMGELISYEFATLVFLTGSPGTLQTNGYTRPGDWNNTNTIETLGGGGSGGALGGANFHATGGGGGAWNKATNVSIGSTASYQVASGGSAVTSSGGTGANGNAGGDGWFNGTTLAGSSVGSKGGGGGSFSLGSSQITGAAGGVGSSGVGSSNNSGGAGGTSASGGYASGTGGGGAAGGTGAGNNGVTASGGSEGSNGGSGDAGSGGSAGAGSTTTNGTNGGNGTEWDSTHGSGGGGGGVWYQSATARTAGSGGNYGGAGGGCYNNAATSSTSGAGIQGIIVITYTPVASTGAGNIPMLGM